MRVEQGVKVFDSYQDPKLDETDGYCVGTYHDYLDGAYCEYAVEVKGEVIAHVYKLETAIEIAKALNKNAD